MIKLPKTEPIPAPDPATPTVAARSSKRVLLRLYSPLVVLARTTHRVGLSDGEEGLPCASSQAYGSIFSDRARLLALLTTADAQEHHQTIVPDSGSRDPARGCCCRTLHLLQDNALQGQVLISTCREKAPEQLE